jgi:predicted DNA-binding transcriptional regulator YafY
MSDTNVRRRDRQIVRVLWRLKALGQGSQVSVAELARRFGTRRETIYRDLRTLEDVGYPIQGDENGRISRPRLLDGTKHAPSPELRLTRGECSALLCLIRQGSTGGSAQKGSGDGRRQIEGNASDPFSGEDGSR